MHASINALLFLRPDSNDGRPDSDGYIPYVWNNFWGREFGHIHPYKLPNPLHGPLATAQLKPPRHQPLKHGVGIIPRPHRP